MHTRPMWNPASPTTGMNTITPATIKMNLASNIVKERFGTSSSYIHKIHSTEKRPLLSLPSRAVVATPPTQPILFTVWGLNCMYSMFNNNNNNHKVHFLVRVGLESWPSILVLAII